MKQIEGKYEILEKMGEGGMGAVYKVRHRLLEEIRVIKVMRPHLAADENLRERFLREAKTAIRLRHPNVAQLHDCTVDEEGNAFMVIEYIEGVTLEEMLKEGGTPPIGLTLEIAGQSLKALGSLHRKKVVHRDIAPDNLMLSRDDEGEPLVKLIDLGIAKVLEAVDAGLTATGMFIGKLRYSSPEHFRTHDGASVDARSDLYSFGVVLYEMLTGTHPIEGESMSSLIAGHLVHPPLDFARSDPEGRVPDELRAIVLKSLAKDPGDRFQSAAEFRKALAPIAKRFPVATADVNRALSATPPPTIRFPAMRKGSTQEKLDRQFVPEATPPQPFTEVTPAPVPAPEAEEMAAVAEVARRVEAHLARGQLREASQELADSETKFGPAEKLIALKQRIEEERGRKEQRRRAEALKAEAIALAEQNDYDAALAKLQQAVEIVPTDTAVQVQIADIEAARAKAAAVAEAVVLVERLVGAGDLEAAERELNEAVLRLGESAPLLGSKKKIEARRASQRQWQERVRALISEGRELLSSGALQEARARLDEAASLAPDSADVTGLAGDLAAAEREREQEQNRRQKIRQAIDGITQRIDSGALPAARSALDKAERQFQDAESFRELKQRLGRLEEQSERDRALARAVRSVESELERGRLEQAQKEVLAAIAELGELEALQGLRARVDAEFTTRRERDEKVAALVEDAHQRAAAGELEMALERLREANRFDPENASVQSLVGDFEAALRRREEERKRQEQISAAAARIERHLEGSALEEARGELERAMKASGDADQLVKLRERLEVAEKRALAEQLHRLLGVAQQLFEAERFEEAIAQLKTALSLDSSDETAAGLLAECQEALRAQRQERKQQQRVARSAAVVEELLGAGKVTKASRRLAAAEKRFGPNEVLQALKQRVEKAVAAAPAPPQPWQRRLLAPLVVGAVIVAIVVVVVMVQRRGAAVAPGETPSGGESAAAAATSTLLVDAIPWGQITAIIAADNTPRPVPDGGYTPIVLTLAPGSYTLTLTHPSRAKPVTLQITLEDGARVSEVVELGTPDLDSFFKDMGW
ncbi:MAG: protein kinase [Thermoanaerobaculales bacterium]